MATYRQLSAEEVEQFTEEQRRYTSWVAVRDFALDWYGSHAAVVTIDWKQEYDDEGGYDPVISKVRVDTAHGIALTPDPDAPATRDAIERRLRKRRANGSSVLDALQSGAALATLVSQDGAYQEAKYALPIPDDDPGVVDLRREPQRRWRDVYVAEPDPEATPT